MDWGKTGVNRGRLLGERTFAFVVTVVVLITAGRMVVAYHDQFIGQGDDSFYRGRLAEAFNAYETARRLVPWSVPANLGIATTLRSQRNLPQAERVLERALLLAPRDRRLLGELGVCRAFLRDWGGAIAAFRRLGRVSPGDRALAEKMVASFTRRQSEEARQ